MLAFAWIGWFTLSALFVATVMYAATNRALNEPAHGYWVRDDPRASTYSGQYPTVRV